MTLKWVTIYFSMGNHYMLQHTHIYLYIYDTNEIPLVSLLGVHVLHFEPGHTKLGFTVICQLSYLVLRLVPLVVRALWINLGLETRKKEVTQNSDCSPLYYISRANDVFIGDFTSTDIESSFSGLQRLSCKCMYSISSLIFHSPCDTQGTILLSTINQAFIWECVT